MHSNSVSVCLETAVSSSSTAFIKSRARTRSLELITISHSQLTGGFLLRMLNTFHHYSWNSCSFMAQNNFILMLSLLSRTSHDIIHSHLSSNMFTTTVLTRSCKAGIIFIFTILAELVSIVKFAI